MNTVPTSIPVLRWAADRAWLDDAELEIRFKKWSLWLSGDAMPTLRQLAEFAHLTHTPFDYFFLPDPPQVTLPVPDFRTRRDEQLYEPSPAFWEWLISSNVAGTVFNIIKKLKRKKVDILPDPDERGNERAVLLQYELKRYGVVSTRKILPFITANDLIEHLMKTRGLI